MVHIHRFFVPPEDITNNKLTIKKKEEWHIRGVLRLSPDEIIEVFDGKGNSYQVKLTEVSHDRVEGNIIERHKVSVDTPRIILAQGIPRARKMDMIIQKATELGVSEIVPLITARTVVRLDNESRIKKRDRWQRIACNATSQCRRLYVPSIGDIVTIECFCRSQYTSSTKIVLWEEEERGLREVLKDIDNRYISIIIGPEGGLENEEVNMTRRYGFITAGLGKAVLRSETTPIAVISIIQFLLKRIG